MFRIVVVRNGSGAQRTATPQVARIRLSDLRCTVLTVSDVTGVLDASFTLRAKALACTAPLHDLDARKAQMAADWTCYQMGELALNAIDLVTLAMDFDKGAAADEIIVGMLPMAAAQAPGRASAEHLSVCRWVLENLINVGSLDRGFRAVYGTADAGGSYQRRTFDFKLLVELAGPTGEIYLRSTDEAVNVLIGALDIDVESAQIAAELKLATLIKRGQLIHAKVAAQQARYRTIQYADLLRRRLDATRRDVRSVDWLTEMPTFLRSALDHIEDRFAQETAISEHITEARDAATNPDEKKQAAQLVEIVNECLRRHAQLQARLQEAGRLFRSEQDRQTFVVTPVARAMDLFAELLRPTLALALEDAIGPTDAFFRAAIGVQTSSVPRLMDLVEALLTPRHEPETPGVEESELDLTPAPDGVFFTDEQYQHAVDLFDDIDPDAPRRLSGLLEEARSLDVDLPHLVGLLAIFDLAPSLGEAISQREQRVTLAVDDGELLDDPEFGGADLLVARGVIRKTPDGATAAPAADARAEQPDKVELIEQGLEVA